MSASVTLLMAIHCHQPVGNFGFVFEQAYAKSYDPFLRVLERHPGVRLALHYSGPLLDWFAANRPQFLARVKALAASGQVELLGGGYYEPILPMLPEADRQGQLALMRDALRERFGAQARGAWLTERVWEPDLPSTFAKAGIAYTMVDANQFLPLRARLPRRQQLARDGFWDLWGSYTAACGGKTVRLFPASKRLRYWMPFQPAQRTIEFLRGLRRDDPVLVSFADDGEKFGMWPSTHKWVYEEGWLEQFFSALEQERGWLATATFDEALAAHASDGKAALPAGSYEEMLEWSGGNFRNFFGKYPEAEAMRQKMLRVSRTIQTLKPRTKTLQQAERALYQAQCNCAYWHGVFGGLYLSHLRRAVYSHLIEAERLLDRRRPAGVEAFDADGDHKPELHLRTGRMGLLLDPAEGGALTAWDLYTPRVNLLDTLTRREEAYHAKLRAKQPEPVAVGGVASIHELAGVKEENLAVRLVYDDHRRTSFLDYGLSRMPTLEEVARSTWSREPLWSPGPCRARRAGAGRLQVELSRRIGRGQARKRVALSRAKPVAEFTYALEGVQASVAALEFNLSLRDERYVREVGQRPLAERFEMAESWSGIGLRISFEPAATVFHFPIETISESEEGLERTYQGLCLLCCWPLQPERPWQARLRWTVEGA